MTTYHHAGIFHLNDRDNPPPTSDSPYYEPPRGREVEIVHREDGTMLSRITVQRQPWMDDGDMIGETTQKVVEWASRNGFSYDDLDWEYI